tara:strand:- start:8850 stop:10760 length:1911 start_codon:yes stop_codon:yes gene_type:complete
MAEIRHVLTADADQLLQTMEDVNGAFDENAEATGDADKQSKQFTKTTKGLAIGLAATTALMAKGVMVAINYGDALGKMSERTGLAVEFLSGLDLLAQKSDTSIQTLARGVSTLSKGLLDATINGTGPVADGLAELGISATQANGTLKDSESVFKEISTALAEMENGTVKTALAQKLFGGAGRELIPLLNQSADGIERNIKASEELGLVWSDEASQSAEDFNDALTDLKSVSDSFFNAAAQSYLPVLSDIVQGAVLAARAFMMLGVAQRDADKDAREGAQAAIRDQSERVVGLKEQLKLLKGDGVRIATIGWTAFQEEIAAATAELDNQIRVLDRLNGELGAEAGLITDESRLLRDSAAARGEVTDTVAKDSDARKKASEEAADAASAEKDRLDLAAEEEAERLAAAREAQEEFDEFLEGRKNRDIDRAEAVKQARIDAEVAAFAVAGAVADSLVSLTDLVSDAAVNATEKDSEARKKALKEQFIATKIAAIAQALVNTALGISNAIGNAPNPIVGAILGVVAGIAGGIAVAAIAAKPPPQFHDGGMVSDEIDIRARSGEVVVPNPEVRAAGGVEGVAAALGSGGGGSFTIVQKLDHKVVDAQTHSAVRRSGSPLDSALRATNPRGTGRRNPYQSRA